HAGDVVTGAEAPGYLKLQRRGREGGDQFVLAWLPCPRAVEVDDMRPLRAGFGEGRQRFGGFGGVRRGIVEPPLCEADDPSAHQVHGGVEDHDSRNAFRKRAPASPERSGWNCAPNQLSLRMTAGIARP